MTKLLCTIVLVLMSVVSLGQYEISGKVTEEGKGVSQATVLLLKATDSSLFKSALTNGEGQFLFEAIPSGRYWVAISTPDI